MNNRIQINKKYVVAGRYVKVIKITPKYVEVRWGHNGSAPVRRCDRFISLNMVPHFKEV